VSGAPGGSDGGGSDGGGSDGGGAAAKPGDPGEIGPAGEGDVWPASGGDGSSDNDGFQAAAIEGWRKRTAGA
jgi:hypothetical protein